ncbi:MAG: hypothetical protein HW416_1374 [Chloroflexi bacterium]|nr:hypothetical protein [Chloroflexota bacterium]
MNQWREKTAARLAERSESIQGRQRRFLLCMQQPVIEPKGKHLSAGMTRTSRSHRSQRGRNEACPKDGTRSARRTIPLGAAFKATPEGSQCAFGFRCQIWPRVGCQRALNDPAYPSG